MQGPLTVFAQKVPILVQAVVPGPPKTQVRGPYVGLGPLGSNILTFGVGEGAQVVDRAEGRVQVFDRTTQREFPSP